MFTALSAVPLNDLQPSTGTGVQPNTPGVTVPRQATSTVSQTDTVKLSVTQQVRNLHSEGEGPGQIASSLGLTSSQVNGDLYVSLTWPQLLSKVASSSLTFGSTSDVSLSGTAAPVTGTATSPAVIFPANKSASQSATPAAPGAKDLSAPDAAIFPVAKYASAFPAVPVPASQDATAA